VGVHHEDDHQHQHQLLLVEALEIETSIERKTKKKILTSPLSTNETKSWDLHPI
jgi:hypothetical protein